MSTREGEVRASSSGKISKQHVDEELIYADASRRFVKFIRARCHARRATHITYISLRIMILKQRSQNGFPSRWKNAGSSNGLLQLCQVPANYQFHVNKLI